MDTTVVVDIIVAVEDIVGDTIIVEEEDITAEAVVEEDTTTVAEAVELETEEVAGVTVVVDRRSRRKRQQTNLCGMVIVIVNFLS